MKQICARVSFFDSRFRECHRSCRGQAPHDPQRPVGHEAARGAGLSPDGRTVVFTVQEWSVEKNKSTTNLWLVDVAGGDPRRLTTAQATDSAPAWSPDGRRIAFVSKRGDDETSALYVIPSAAARPRRSSRCPSRFPHQMAARRRALIVATNVIPELVGTLAREIAAMKKEAKRRKDSKMTAKVTENRQYRFFDRYLTDNLAPLLLVNVATKELGPYTRAIDCFVPTVNRATKYRPMARKSRW